MAGRHAAVVPRSRSRSPQAVARTDPGEMISEVRGVSGISAASIEMHTHDRCRVLKRRISSAPQRTYVQERTTKRVMVSSVSFLCRPSIYNYFNALCRLVQFLDASFISGCMKSTGDQVYRLFASLYFNSDPSIEMWRCGTQKALCLHVLLF